MVVIPTINCFDFNCVKEKFKKLREVFGATGGWAQIDVSDGELSQTKTWNNPSDLNPLKDIIENFKLNIEIHLMVKNPESIVLDWLAVTGLKRIIVHIEAIDKNKISFWQKLRLKGIEIGLAINPATPAEKLIPYLNCSDKNFCSNFVLVLAVEPGPSGQKFRKEILNKIVFIKNNYPDVKIEVDGGVGLETGKLCKEAGADILASGSYIFESDNPRDNYEELTAI